MCLILWKPKDQTIDLAILQSAFDKNKDGWGMMRYTRKGIIVRRGKGNFQNFIETYNKEFKDYECALHFRTTTRGYSTVDDTHPIKITENDYLMHNGTMLNIPIYNDKESDSWNLCEMIRPMVEHGWLNNNYFGELIESVMGNTNRGIILSNDNGWIFLNKHHWREYQGCWYSNIYAWKLPADLQKEVDDEEALTKALINISEIFDMSRNEKWFPKSTIPPFQAPAQPRPIQHGPASTATVTPPTKTGPVGQILPETRRAGFRSSPANTKPGTFALMNDQQQIEFYAKRIQHGSMTPDMLLQIRGQKFLSDVERHMELDKELQDVFRAENLDGDIPALPETIGELLAMGFEDINKLNIAYPDRLVKMMYDELGTRTEKDLQPSGK